METNPLQPDNSSPPKSPQHLLVSYSLLTALTPLIPIPLLDDIVFTQLRRDFVRRLASQNEVKLSGGDVKVLADAAGGSCLWGCLGGAVIYLVKRIFRKIFFFLEWKRAADIMSQTYYHGFVIDTALQEGAVNSHGATAVRAALDRALGKTNTSVLNRAAWGLVRQSKNGLKQLVSLLVGSLPRRDKNLDEVEVSQAVEDVEKKDAGQLGRLTGLFEQALKNVPAEHFSQIRDDFLRELEVRPPG